jgi:hypothetical protein
VRTAQRVKTSVMSMLKHMGDYSGILPVVSHGFVEQTQMISYGVRVILLATDDLPWKVACCETQ